MPCQQGMTRESDYKQQTCRHAETISKQNAEFEKALNSAKSSVVLQQTEHTKLAQQIVLCAPSECAASPALQHGQVGTVALRSRVACFDEGT